MVLAAGVELGVVGGVIVAFCEEFERFVSVVNMIHVKIKDDSKKKKKRKKKNLKMIEIN